MTESEIFQNLSAMDAGVIMVAVIYLVEKIIGWVVKLRGTQDGPRNCVDNTKKLQEVEQGLSKIHDLLKQLFDMHNVKDRDQVPVWYLRQSFVDAVSQMSKELDAINRSISELEEDLECQTAILREIDKFHAKMHTNKQSEKKEG